MLTTNGGFLGAVLAAVAAVVASLLIGAFTTFINNAFNITPEPTA